MAVYVSRNSIYYATQYTKIYFCFSAQNEMLYNVLKRQYWADNGRTELSLRDEVT